MKNSNVSQMLFDYMFNDLENNLREMGFGDIAANKKMKGFKKPFMVEWQNIMKACICLRLIKINHCFKKQS